MAQDVKKMRYVFSGKKGTYVDGIQVIINADTDKDAWDILEGMSRVHFSYWDMVCQA